MKTYADTSFLFSIYASDTHSPRADVWRLANPGPLPFTSFHRFELRNALSLAVFRRQLTPTEAQNAWEGVEVDCEGGILETGGVLWDSVLAEAQRSAREHTPAVGCRALDVLHVAIAKVIGVTDFCTFDERQSELAGRIGLVRVSV